MGKVKDSLIDTKEWLDYLDQLDEISVDYDFEDEHRKAFKKHAFKKKNRRKYKEDYDFDF